MAAAAAAAVACMRTSASWDLNPFPIPIVNPNLPKKNTKSLRTSTNKKPAETATATTTSLQKKKGKETSPVSELFKHDDGTPANGKMDEQYLGYERWLPVAPKVNTPRAIYNAASLAYLGDCIYELYARRHFLFPPLSIEEYNDRVMAVVRCEAQDALLKKLLDDDFLSEEERDILRWGKNIGSGKTRTVKRAGVAVYNRASSLEALVGYLYLTDVKRLEEVMQKLGFSSDGSTRRCILHDGENI